jgi:hypothetical protein
LALARLDGKQEAIKPLDVNDPPDAMYNVLNFLEHLSLLANHGYVDEKMVWNEFGYWMFNIYADSRPLIDDDQRTDAVEFIELTKLMEKLRRIEIADGHSAWDHPSPDDILSLLPMRHCRVTTTEGTWQEEASQEMMAPLVRDFPLEFPPLTLGSQGIVSYILGCLNRSDCSTVISSSAASTRF